MSETVKHYKELLFTYPKERQGFKTYAIVDSIRDERIKEKMIFAELKFLDLWDEALFENEQEVPLYLIEVKKDDALTLWLIENHNKNAVTYFQSAYNIEALQDYYSTYTFPYVEMKAKGYEEEIPRGIFGFYDPKVLPDYMQTLYTQEKREAFFAGLAVCFSPDVHNEKRCHAYYLAEKGVAYREVNMTKEHRALDTIAYQEPLSALHSQGIPTLDAQQIAIFERLAHERFVKEVVQDLHDGGNLTQSVETLLPKALHVAAYAKSLGIDSQANMARFIQIGLHLPKPIEHYNDTKEFKAIAQVSEELKKRDLLQTLLKGMKLKEVA